MGAASCVLLLATSCLASQGWLRQGEVPRFAIPAGVIGTLEFELPFEVGEPVQALVLSRLESRSPAGASLKDQALQVELVVPAAAGEPGPPYPAGTPVMARLRVRASDLEAAGEYRITAWIAVTPALPAGTATLEAGPPAPPPEASLEAVVTRLAGRLDAAPAAVVVPVEPWQRDIETRASVPLRGEGLGQVADLEVRPRGEPRHASGIRVPLVAEEVGVVGGPAGPVLVLAVLGQAPAGRSRIPLELRAPGVMPAALDLELRVRHRPRWLLGALVAGLVAGLGLGIAARLRARGAEIASALGRERTALEGLLARTPDPAFAGRLRPLIGSLAAREARSSQERARRALERARGERDLALRDLETRRLDVEAGLVRMEAESLPSPSDPEPVGELLESHERRLRDLRHRLERGEVGPVAESLGPLRHELVAALDRAGRTWLGSARDLLDALRDRLGEAAHGWLLELVRPTLEDYARAIAEASEARLSELLQAGRWAATQLGENVHALAFRSGYRGLSEAFGHLEGLLAEAERDGVDRARQELASAIEAGQLREPLRQVKALGRFQERLDSAIRDLAGESLGAEHWRAVREALERGELLAAAAAARRVAPARGRKSSPELRAARVVELVRLAPRPPRPAVRLLWDGPPAAGFPVRARIVWLTKKPQRFQAHWLVEGLPARVEEPYAEETGLTFRKPGFALLRVEVVVEGEAAPLIAQARVRVLEGAGVAVPERWRTRTSADPLGWGLSLLLGPVVGYLLLAPRFDGTLADYVLAGGCGLLAALLVDTLGGLLRARGAPRARRGS